MRRLWWLGIILAALLGLQGQLAFGQAFDFDAAGEALEDDADDEDLFGDEDADDEEELDEDLFGGEDADEEDVEEDLAEEDAGEGAEAEEPVEAAAEPEPEAPALAEDEKKAEEPAEPWNPDDVHPLSIQGQKWTLDFKFEAPRPIRIYGTNREPKIYWYILYSATNDTGATRFFAPDFILYTNEAKLHRSGIYPEVHEVIKERRKRRTRFLENSAKIIGNLLEGEDNARDGVAIFAPIGPKTKSFTLFVGGLSGRYILRDNPAAKADTPLAEKKIVLYKTLAVDYKLIGDEWWKDLAAPKVVKTQWTWR